MLLLTGWSKNSESSFISSKHGDNTVANILSTDGRSAYIQKAVTLTAGKRYLIQFDLVRYKSGIPRLIYNGPGYSVSFTPIKQPHWVQRALNSLLLLQVPPQFDLLEVVQPATLILIIYQ